MNGSGWSSIPRWTEGSVEIGGVLHFGSRCGAPSEQQQDVIGQKPRAWGDRVAAAEAVLVGAEEPQRLNQMEMLLGTGHGDIQQTALFLDLRRIAGGHVGGHAAIDEN